MLFDSARDSMPISLPDVEAGSATVLLRKLREVLDGPADQAKA